MTYNIIDVVKDEIRGTANKLTAEERQLRLDVCSVCPHLVKLTRQCGKCGCFIDMKSRYRYSQCDIGSWPL